MRFGAQLDVISDVEIPQSFSGYSLKNIAVNVGPTSASTYSLKFRAFTCASFVQNLSSSSIFLAVSESNIESVFRESG